MGNIMIPGPEILVSSAIETSCFLTSDRGDTLKSAHVAATKRPLSTSQPERFVVPRNELRELTKQLAKKIRMAMKDLITNSARNPPYRIEILKSCEKISLILPEMFTKLAMIEERQHEFDFSPEVPGNGFRSFIHVTDMCLLNISKTLFKIKCERRYATFKGGLYSRELDVLVDALGSLSASIFHLESVLEAMERGNLFLDADDPLSPITLDAMDRVDQEPFYGRLAGFQFCPSMYRSLQVVTISMAAFSEGYVSTSRTTVGRLATSLLSAGSYLVDPESRAKRNVQVTRSANIRFCKAFWSLSDKPSAQLQKQFAAISFPEDTASLQQPADCAVNRVVWLNTKAHYSVTTRDGGQAEVTGPAAEPHSLPVRVISYYRRNGMFQCYLLNWAKELDAIIVSVDYSLSPEHPYPRPVEEVVFAYSWVLNHAKHLGWTGERLVACGDSAGALLVVCSMLKLSSLNIQRLPDAIVPIYGCFLVEYCISPSRFLSLLDPLLPIGILVRCMAAYTGHSESELSRVRSPSRRGGSVARFYLDSDITEESDDDAEVLGKTEEYVAEMQRSRSTLGRTNSLSVQGRTPQSIDFPPPVTANRFTLELEIPPQMWELRDYFQKWRRNAEREERKGSSSSAPGRPKKLRHSATFSIGESITDVASYLGHEFYGYVKSFKPSESTAQFSTLHTIAEEGPSSYKPSTLTATSLLPFQRMEVPKTPFLSPYYATDDELAKLPAFRIIACHLDPLLDDSVMFAKRLRNAGNDVKLHLVPDLPHGFLNLTHVSGDCHMAAKRCMALIDHAFQ